MSAMESRQAVTRTSKWPVLWSNKWRRTRYVLIRVVGIVLILVALVGGGSRLLSGSRLLTGTNEPIRIVAVGPEPEAVSTDALTHRAFVINQGDKSLDVIDTETGSTMHAVALPVNRGVMAVDTRTARVFVANTGDDVGGVIHAAHSVMVLDARDGQVVRVVQTGVLPQAITVDDALGRVYVGTATASGEAVQILDASNGALLRTVVLGRTMGQVDPLSPPSPCAVAIDERHNRVIVAGSASSSLYVVDAKSGHVIRSTFIPIRLCPQAAATLAVSEGTGHTFIGIGFPTNRVLMFDTRSGKLLHTTTYQRRSDEPRAIAIDESLARIFLLTGLFGGDSVQVLDAHSGTNLRTIARGQEYDAIAVDTRKHLALLASVDTTRRAIVDQWGWIPGAIRRRLPFLPPQPSSRRNAGRIDVIDTRTGRLVRVFLLPTAPRTLIINAYAGRAFALGAGSLSQGGRIVGRGMMAIINLS